MPISFRPVLELRIGMLANYTMIMPEEERES
jgi:hypothetical protein